MHCWNVSLRRAMRRTVSGASDDPKSVNGQLGAVASDCGSNTGASFRPSGEGEWRKESPGTRTGNGMSPNAGTVLPARRRRATGTASRLTSTSCQSIGISTLPAASTVNWRSGARPVHGSAGSVHKAW